MTGRKSFGALIRALREERQITLRKFAARIGVSPTYLSNIERGQFAVPTEDRIRAIARELDQDPDELLALAGRVSEDLDSIIRKQPKPLATFLRTTKGLSASDIERLTKEAKRLKKD